MFEGRIQFAVFAGHIQAFPEFLAELGNALKRQGQAFFAARHAAVVPEQAAQFAVERAHRALAFG